MLSMQRSERGYTALRSTQAWSRRSRKNARTARLRHVIVSTMNIGLVRRGYSPTGGAENYLNRLGRALVERGFGAKLYTTEEWPDSGWVYGNLVRFKALNPWKFAQE